MDYFELCNIDEVFWATAAALNMDGNAAKWLHVYKKQHGLGDWNTFISAVEKKFGANDYRDAMSELLELKQTDTVEEYARAFENLQFEISMYNDGFDDTFFVSQFIKGLKLDISAGVRAQVPKDVDEAILLAKVQQQVLEKGKHKWSKAAASTKFQSSTSKGEGKTGPQPSTMWKERQTLNYRKANNLCYYCGEKYDPNHAAICAQRPKAQLNALVTNPLDMPLSEEVVAQLELEDSLASEFCQLSLNALAGTAHGDAMQIQALVQNKTMLTLIDTGSSHSFVSAAFLDTVGIKPVPTVPRQVKLANGQVLQSDLWVPNMPWFCNGHTLHADMRVLDITAFDAILGYDWLKPLSPMTCHWTEKTMEFCYQGKQVCLQGVQPSPCTVQELSADQLVKLWKGNDVWALALVVQDTDHHSSDQPQEIQDLLKQYADVFQTPK